MAGERDRLPDFPSVAPVSRALALRDWERAYTLMDGLVGFALAARWLALEMELAGVIDPTNRDDHSAQRRGSGIREDD